MTVTASLGVSALGQGARDPQALLEQADKCMYMAKRNGRNQVARWDELPEDVQIVSVTSVDVLRKGWRLGDDVGCRVCVGRDRDGSHFG
jgi:predicted signal transduction protein with EAL and GGDEF domain